MPWLFPVSAYVPILKRQKACRAGRQGIVCTARRHLSAEDKIRIELEGLRGEGGIAGSCWNEGITESLYYVWSNEFIDAGKRVWQATRPVLPPLMK